jgi:hypothetical protein
VMKRPIHVIMPMVHRSRYTARARAVNSARIACAGRMGRSGGVGRAERNREGD